MVRALKYVLIGLASLLGLVVLAIAVALLIPDDVYKDWLTDAVQKATGRTLTIGGDFDIQAGTRLKLSAGDVSFANADWGSEPALFHTERLEAEVELLPLVTGVAVATVTADQPRVLIETDDSGLGNWVMQSDAPAPEPAPPREGTGTGIVLAPTIKITNGQFEYRDGVSGRIEQFDLKSFELGAAEEQLKIDLDGLYKEQPISLAGDLGNIRAIATGESTDLALKGQLGGTAVSAQGTWAELLAATGPTVDLTLALDTPSVDTLTPFAGTTVPGLGALNFGGKISGASGSYAANDLLLTLAGPDTQVEVKGSVADLVAVEGVDVSAQAAAGGLSKVVEELGLQLPGEVPDRVELTAALQGGLSAMTLEELVAKVDDPDLQANLSASAEDLLTRKGVLATLDLKAPSLTALSKFAGRELPPSGPITASAELKSQGETYEIPELNVTIEGEDINGRIKGSIADLLAASGINLDLDAHVGSLAQFSALAGVELPATDPLEVKANVVAFQGVNGPAQISAILDSDWLSGQVESTVGDILTAGDIEGDLDLRLSSLAVLSAFAGRELPPMGPIEATGRLASVEKTYKLTDIEVSVQDETLQAQLTGSIADLLAAGGIDLNLDAKVGSLSNFSALAGTELPETKPLNVKAQATASEGAQGPAQIQADVTSDWLNAKVEASIADLLAAQGVDGQLSLELQSLADLSSVAGRELPPMGPVKASAKLASSGESYALNELDLGIEDQALQARLQGTVADLLAAQGIDLSLEGSVSSLADLSELAGTELPDTSSFQMTGSLVAQEGIQGANAIKANVNNANVRADVEGSITDLTTAGTVQLNLALKATSLADVGELVGTELPKLGPLDASAGVNRSGSEIDLIGLVTTLGNSDLQGNLKVILPTQDAQGSATGLFKSKRLDVDQILGAMPDSPQTGQQASAPAPAPATAASTPAQSQSKQAEESATGGEVVPVTANTQKVFADDPLAVEFLALYDAFIELHVSQIKTPDTLMENAKVTVDLQDSVLEIDLPSTLVGDREVKGKLTLDASRQPSPMSVQLHADRIPLSEVIGEETVLQGGRLYVDVDVDGRGNSVAEIMGSLDGRASLAIVDSRLQGEALKRLGQDVVAQINPFTAQQGYSEIECAALAFTLNDGMATTPRGLVSRQTSATWVGDGEINLKTEQMNFTLESKPREGIGLGAGSIAGLVQVSGTLGGPIITPNPVGVAKAGAGAGLAVATGGLSILASGLLNRATSEGDACEEILEFIILGKDPTEGADGEAAKDGG